MSELIKESSNRKTGLGRGLGSLLGESSHKEAAAMERAPTPPAPAQIPTELRVWKIAVDKLQPSHYQPREFFDKVALQELADSIKENGIIQPLLARRLDSQKFEIIAGERRWRAAQLAGLHEVPVVLKTLANLQALELALIENIQRQDLNALEEAEAYQRLIAEFSLTQQDVARRVGKERATVANSLRLLQLPKEAQKMLVNGEISVGHAKVLLTVEASEERLRLAKLIPKQKISVRALEKLVEKSKMAGATPATSAGAASESKINQRLVSGLADELQKVLGTKINIDYHEGQGKISIRFYSDEELSQLVEMLKDRGQR